MKIKEKKLHPALLLFVLTIIIMIVSSVGGILNLETTYYNVNAVTGELETVVVTIKANKARGRASAYKNSSIHFLP